MAAPPPRVHIHTGPMQQAGYLSSEHVRESLTHACMIFYNVWLIVVENT